MLTLLSCTQYKGDVTSAISSLIEPIGGWQYRAEDSPVSSSDGSFIGLKDSLNSSEWISVASLNEIPTHAWQGIIWLRVQLPDQAMSGRSIFMGSVVQIVQVFLEERPIYQHGDFRSYEDCVNLGRRCHLIPLPNAGKDNQLTLRLWSCGEPVALVALGPTDTIILNLFVSNLDEIIFSALYLIMGAVFFILFFFINRDRLFLGLALFIMVIGVFTGSNSMFLQTVFYAPRLFFVLDLLSLYASPIGCLILMEQVILKKYRMFFRRLWQIHLLHLLAGSVTILFPGIPFPDMPFSVFFILTFTSIGISLYLILLCIRRGGVELKLLFMGVVIFFLFASIEIVLFFYRRSDMIISGINWVHIGAFCFVASLVWIAVHRYVETHRQKEAAQKEALEAAKFQELDQMKSRFFANISHDFRTPLTLILGSARRLLAGEVKTDVDSQYKMQIRNGERLLNLVNELLDLSRVDAGKLKLNASHEDLVLMIQTLVIGFETYAADQDINISFYHEIEKAMLWVDHDKMEKILINLISNAIKFTPAGGTVEVSLIMDEQAKIAVKDSGKGISESQLPHVFDRFYQAETGYVKDQPGSGIGLALTRELVQLHTGEITVESELDKGSIFTVTLPLGRDHLSEEDVAGAPKSHIPLIRGTEGVNGSVPQSSTLETTTSPGSHLPLSRGTEGIAPILLIIEDNDDMRTFIHDILKGKYQTLEAANGRDGFKIAVESIPDLIISDVMMPVMDGYTLCKKLKNDQRTSHIPVILLTAKSTGESKMEGLDLGADDYLTKPFDSAELTVRIRNLIDQRRRLRKRFGREALFGTSGNELVSADQAFLKRAMDLLEQHLENPDLDVDWFSKEMGLSRSQLHRKLQGLTDKSASEFIRFIRLKRAALLLEQKTASVSEIAYQVGFNNLAWFRKCFRAQFGMAPSEYFTNKDK